MIKEVCIEKFVNVVRSVGNRNLDIWIYVLKCLVVLVLKFVFGKLLV